MRRYVGVLLILGLLVAVGCGSDDDTEGTAQEAAEATEEATAAAEDAVAEDENGGEVADVDPCTLLTDEDTKALLAKAVEGKTASKADPASGTPGSCLFELGGSVDLTEPKPFSVGTTVADEFWFSSSMGLVEDDESFEELTGIGDQAFAGNTRAGALFGATAITVELGAPAGPESHDLAVEALERAVANYE